MIIKIKLILNILIGAIITAIIYGAFAFIASATSGEAEALLGVAFLIIMPIALFSGSWVTGYLSKEFVKSIKGYLAITPGIYLAILFVVINFVEAHREFAISMLLPAVIWSLISFLGVWFGIRKNKLKI